MILFHATTDLLRWLGEGLCPADARVYVPDVWLAALPPEALLRLEAHLATAGATLVPLCGLRPIVILARSESAPPAFGTVRAAAAELATVEL